MTVVEQRGMRMSQCWKFRILSHNIKLCLWFLDMVQLEQYDASPSVSVEPDVHVEVRTYYWSYLQKKIRPHIPQDKSLMSFNMFLRPSLSVNRITYGLNENTTEQFASLCRINYCHNPTDKCLHCLSLLTSTGIMCLLPLCRIRPHRHWRPLEGNLLKVILRPSNSSVMELMGKSSDPLF